jgi:lysyl-tRNA synthetase class 2
MESPNNLWMKRHYLRRHLRSFFELHDYIEVDTPILVTTPAMEVHLDFFRSQWTDFRGANHPLYLRTSPELQMKPCLATGLDRIYQIGPCFRNLGELGPIHHPEFAMLEYYHSGISFEDFVAFTYEILRENWQHLAKQGAAIPCALPKSPEKITVKQAFQDFAKIDLIDLDLDLAAKAKASGNTSVNLHDDFETAYFKVLIDQIEPRLKALGCVVLCDYPPSQAALAEVENGIAKRFELYIDGIELCNGFRELVDHDENKQRFHQINIERLKLNKEPLDIDHEFFEALRKGIKPCCGNAIGLDRWLAIINGQTNLDAVVPFRTSRPFA